MKALVLFSGGLDSSVCLGLAVKKYGKDEVLALSIYYGQKHKKEMEASEKVANYYGVKRMTLDLGEIFKDSNCTLLEGASEDIPHEEYEVICVDDCSPDGSRAIVEQLQQEYPTLRLVCHERNKKLGGARNTGLKEAKGRYIWFVDSDDTISPNILQTLLKTAENSNLDILQFDYTN
jgi:cellulose synthase/poly-beta-1,6-N-acetylglucosamine synthase-like glycosyltransferase